MKPLSKGDTCRVRLHTGEVVEAVCAGKNSVGIIVDYDNDKFFALNGTSARARQSIENYSSWECRLVGNPCVLLPVGVSV